MKTVLKLLACWAAFAISIPLYAIVLSIFHLEPVVPPNAGPAYIQVLGSLAGGLVLVAGMWPLAQHMAAALSLRAFRLSGFLFLVLGVNGTLEARIFTNFLDRGISGPIIFYLIQAVMVGALLGFFGTDEEPTALAPAVPGFLYPEGNAPDSPQSTSGTLQTVSHSASATDSPRFGANVQARHLLGKHSDHRFIALIGRGAAAWLGWPVIYLFFGMCISPIVVPYYRAGIAGLRIPPMSIILQLQLIRSIVFLAASLPLMTMWKGSRRNLWLALGLAHAAVVGLYELIGATFLPLVLRITHSFEITADSFAYAGLLVLLFTAPSARKPAPVVSVKSGEALPSPKP
jgi:hypothetical protein